MHERLIAQIDKVNEDSKNKKGIFFYCKSDHSYIFIETTKSQRFNFNCAKQEQSKPKDMLDLL